MFKEIKNKIKPIEQDVYDEDTYDSKTCPIGIGAEWQLSMIKDIKSSSMPTAILTGDGCPLYQNDKMKEFCALLPGSNIFDCFDEYSTERLRTFMGVEKERSKALIFNARLVDEGKQNPNKVVISVFPLESLYILIAKERQDVESNRLVGIDLLTGLKNRDSAKELLDLECARAEKSNRYFAIGIISIDHFKRINDTFGPFCGDRALKDLSEILKVCIRKVDWCARWGGDEFIVFLNDVNEKTAREMFDLMRMKISRHRVGVQSTFSVTTSMGIFVPSNQVDCGAVISHAKLALKEAKAFGSDNLRIKTN